MKSPENISEDGTFLSLPSRERGLKYIIDDTLIIDINVAPLAGAWIEINPIPSTCKNICNVAPLAGAWIEIE